MTVTYSQFMELEERVNGLASTLSRTLDMLENISKQNIKMAEVILDIGRLVDAYIQGPTTKPATTTGKSTTQKGSKQGKEETERVSCQ